MLKVVSATASHAGERKGQKQGRQSAQSIMHYLFTVQFISYTLIYQYMAVFNPPVVFVSHLLLVSVNTA